jgi:hypothetical protein
MGGTMKAIRIDVVRSGNDAGVLEEGREYHLVVGSSRHEQYDMPIGQRDLNRCLARLRYNPAVGNDERRAAVEALSQFVTPVIEAATAGTDEAGVQLDLVTEARELWALPLEAALAADGRPRFARGDHRVVLTRRTPQDFVERQLSWPAQPRVLFAWASPAWAGGTPVPAAQHLEILLAVLQPYMPPRSDTNEALPNPAPVLTVLENASLDAIRDACAAAVKNGDPYTHVHLLAHGIRIEDEVDEEERRYGIALESPDEAATEADALTLALCPARPPEEQRQERPVVVSLAICDGANATNTLIQTGGAAQELHREGVPVVLASQLPLTFGGSAIMLREFYGAWMEGCDAREALHRTRVALYEAREAQPVSRSTGHDWLSLAAYVRLPEGYADYLFEVRLRGQLAGLENASRFADHLVLKDARDAWQYDDATRRIQSRIRRLHELLEEIPPDDRHRRRDVLQENAGMLASAYKRFAELLARRAAVDPENAERWRAESGQALATSREHYEKAYRSNTSHHWSGVQYLALQAVTQGAIPRVGEWYACQFAAENGRSHGDSEDDRIWALGSLAELALLAPLAPGAPHAAGEADAALTDLCGRVLAPAAGSRLLSPIHSTRRQLMRYVTWWTKGNGFFGGRDADLSAGAQRLVALLDAEVARPR